MFPGAIRHRCSPWRGASQPMWTTQMFNGGGWEAPGFPQRGAALQRFSARCKPGVTDALVSYRRGVWKEMNASRHKIRFFFGVRNWMCGVRACENMQKRVSHGETVRVGSSVIIIRGNYGAFFAPLLVISGAKLYFLRAVLPFALVYFRRWIPL